MTACARPPTGWRCTREAGHDGPCAALPTTPADETLPKRGDRVRVTEVIASVPLSPEVGEEVTLSCDAREEPLGIVFMFWGNGRDGGGQWHSGYVKVEILERAIHPTHVTPGSGDAPACPACGATTRPETSEPCRGHSAEFARGMRRAVEIAEGLSSAPIYEGILARLREAVEKELAGD